VKIGSGHARKKYPAVEEQKILRRLLIWFAVCAAGLFGAVTGAPADNAAAFKQCRSCHQVGANAKNGVGPHLNGLFGRRAGSVEGARYSDDMVRSGQNGLRWTAETLDQYLQDPRKLISRTLMSFRGLKSAEDRAAVIAYLRTFSDKPSDIPEAAPTASTTSHDPALNPDILAIQGDTEYGEYLAGECVSCHQASGADNGIPSIVGWPTDIFVTAMHAYRNKSRTHPVMRMIAAPLNNEEIASLAAYFKSLKNH